MFRQQELFESPGAEIWSVSEVHRRVQKSLERSFDTVRVEGEISNAKQVTSGHWYFTLKDERAQLSCVMFRNAAARLRFRLAQGLGIRAHGRLQIYAPRGSFQLMVDEASPVGQGALELAFQQLKEKLNAEGLFDAGRKKKLPRIPRRIALVTSPTGAAVRDLLSSLPQRWPLLTLFVVPTQVQGDEAPRDIVHSLRRVQRHGGIDVVVLARGGGSLEDLWAFNDERVAREIAACEIPTVSAIGHEVDFTIADFVADVRAATPTAVAALVTPDHREVRRFVRQAQKRLARGLSRCCEVRRQRLKGLVQSYGLRKPELLVREQRQRLDEKLERARRAVVTHLKQLQTRSQSLQSHLRALSPAGVLSRGYVFVVDDDNRIVGSVRDTEVEQRLRMVFHDGDTSVRVLNEPRLRRVGEALGWSQNGEETS